ncbi:MAG: formate dehydrogenase accessory sulfurtransferase FdhD, partial [Candidatus Brocadiae bacterium]|nr:formate dehydrogenase accessory sulfurtransferase FdhD [Candidatus Brocadiia bacterium]
MPGVGRRGVPAPERNPVTVRAVRRGARPGRRLPPAGLDAIAVEEPLEIRLRGRTLAVTMRTPGLERAMVLGFLLAEGLIRSAADVSVRHDAKQNIVHVRGAAGRGLLAVPARRGTLTTSACGVCGRV